MGMRMVAVVKVMMMMMIWRDKIKTAYFSPTKFIVCLCKVLNKSLFLVNKLHLLTVQLLYMRIETKGSIISNVRREEGTAMACIGLSIKIKQRFLYKFFFAVDGSKGFSS
jgi:hypothetical protein